MISATRQLLRSAFFTRTRQRRALRAIDRRAPHSRSPAAVVAPIGGHDGHGEPSCNGNFHWLHHAKFECNYGVPWPICFDTMFGTFVDYAEFKKNGNKMPKKLAASVATRRGEGAGKKE